MYTRFNINIILKILFKSVILKLITLSTNIRCELYSFEPPNLKTVLFKETDLMPRCWSTLEVDLLLNRRVMQDLIPRKIPRDLPMLVKYLKNVEETVSQIPPGINQTLVMAAMADVVGGYLQAIVIPIANEAYYAGNVDYKTVNTLHDTLDKWKWFLSTDGGTWSQECDMRKIPTKVTVLELNLKDAEAACQELYVSPPVLNETDMLGSETVVAESSRVAIPYFDNNIMPNAIALPFKKRNLYSLFDPKAAYVLVKYYTLTMRCLSGNANDVLAFNNFFHQWIVSKVVPHLHDQDRWYPAFGAVMRVMETIKQKGLASVNPVFVQPLGDDHQDAALNANLEVVGLKHNGRVTNLFHVLNNPYAILYLLIFLGLLLLIICCLCVCFCWKCRQSSKKTICFTDDCSENVLKNAIISLYCGIKESMSGSSTTKMGSNDSNTHTTKMGSNDSNTHTKDPDYDNRPYKPNRNALYRPPGPSEVSLSVTTSDDEESDERSSP